MHWVPGTIETYAEIYLKIRKQGMYVGGGRWWSFKWDVQKPIYTPYLTPPVSLDHTKNKQSGAI